jgi:hypothetical protein
MKQLRKGTLDMPHYREVILDHTGENEAFSRPVPLTDLTAAELDEVEKDLESWLEDAKKDAEFLRLKIDAMRSHLEVGA